MGLDEFDAQVDLLCVFECTPLPITALKLPACFSHPAWSSQVHLKMFLGLVLTGFTSSLRLKPQ